MYLNIKLLSQKTQNIIKKELETKNINKNETKESFIKRLKSEYLKHRNFNKLLSDNSFYKIGSGSSRIVYKNDYHNIVIKKAKNIKGISANNHEYSLYNDYYTKSIHLAKVFNELETNNINLLFVEFYNKIDAKKFKEKYKFSFKQFSDTILYLQSRMIQDNYRLQNTRIYLKDNNKLLQMYLNNELDENKEYKEIYDLIYYLDNNLIRSYELIDFFSKRQLAMDSNNNLVLIDYGLNYRDFLEYYRKT